MVLERNYVRHLQQADLHNCQFSQNHNLGGVTMRCERCKGFHNHIATMVMVDICRKSETETKTDGHVYVLNDKSV